MLQAPDERRVNEYLKAQSLSPDSIDVSGSALRYAREVHSALGGQRKSSLKMLPTYIKRSYDTIADGTVVAAVDAGGTWLRAARAVYVDGAPHIERVERVPMPGSKSAVTWDEFNDIAADLLGSVVDCDTIPVGYCFSYPASINSDLDGCMLSLTKEVRIEGFEGRFICADLRANTERQSKNLGKINLINDTTAVALAAAPRMQGGDYTALSGFICGTGMNLCCEVGEGGALINTESGNYDGFTQGSLDRLLDAQSRKVGAYRAEKMISGAYLGELCRLALCGAEVEGLLCGEDLTFALHEKGGLTSELADTLCATNSVSGLICKAVFERAARLSASMLLAVAQYGQGSSKPLLVSADGSVVRKSLSYRRELDRLLGSNAKIYAEEDATLKGALVAAIL